jgi:hypothetical protein
MNKLANATVAVVVLGVLGLPPALGLLTESQVRARAAAISAGGVWAVDVRSFERGWFHGRAKIDLALSPAYAQQLGAADAGEMLGLGALVGRTAPLDVELAYGPVAIFDGVHFGVSRMIARLDPEVDAVAQLEQSLNVPHLFEFRGTAGFTGNLAFDADVPPIDLPAAPARMLFSGALIAGTLAGNRLVANVDIDRFEFSSPTGVFTVAGIVAKIDNEIRSRYVLPGNAGFSIQSIAIVDAQRGATPVFEAAGLRVDSATTLDATQTLLDVQATFALDSALIDGAKISDAYVGVALRKLDTQALDDYATASRSLDAAGGGTSAARNLQPTIVRAVAAAPSVALDPVRFTFGGEPFTGRMEIATNTAALPAAGALDLADPATLLKLFDASADLQVSKKLAQQLAALVMQVQYANDPAMPPGQQRLFAEAQSGLMLVALVGQGMLVATDDAYRAELRVTNGAVTLNGAALPFSVP